MQTRAEHLQFCKDRALAYLKSGDVNNALTSMFSDLEKHPETKGHAGIAIGVGLMVIGALSSEHDAKRFIEGFQLT